MTSSLLLAVTSLLLPAAGLCAEFIANGSLSRSAAGGNWCETGSGAFSCWTLTPDNGGGTNYSADEFWPDTRLCGCSGVPCQIYPEISQVFGVSGGGAYTLTWDQRNDQEDCSSRTNMWTAMTAVGTVYYFKDAALTQPCSPASEDTGNVTSATKGVWATISLSNTGHAPLHGTVPADCRYVKVAIKALAKTNTCTATGGNVRAWTEVRNVSFTSTAFTKTSGPDPIISQHPSSQIMIAGEQASFTAAATGPGTVTYQWQKKPYGGSFSDISGAVASSYTTPALTPSDNGNQYRCKVSNACTSVYSNSAALTVLAPAFANTVVDAKGYADGTLVELANKPVSACTSSAYWIQDVTPPSGIKVNSTAYPAPGTLVTVVGTLASTGSERRIEPCLERFGEVGPGVQPYLMLTRSIGGSALNAESPGIPDPYGPNNIGLLVKICGAVTNLGSSYFYLDDGVGLKDGTVTDSQDNVGVRVMAPPVDLWTGKVTDAIGISSVSPAGARAVIPSGCTMPSTQLAVGSSATTLCAGSSATITVASTELGVTYQLRNSSGNVHVGSAVAGDGGTISLPTGALTATTEFNVLATRNVGGCSAQLAQTQTITVYPLPDASRAVGATQTQLEVGQSTDVTVANSQTGVNYQLRKNTDNSNVGSPVPGSGGTIYLPTGTLGSAGNYPYNVLATNASTGCSQQLNQVVTITVGHTGTVTGRVLNALAQPIAGATVTLSSGGGSATTNSSGSYTIPNVVAGTYTLTASAGAYQSHTWDNVIVTANNTTTVWDYYLPHNWSKIGLHSQFNITEDLSADRWGYPRFFTALSNCAKTCQMVKSVADFAATYAASVNCPGSLRVGRIIDLPGLGDLQAYNDQWAAGIDPAEYAETVYYGPNHNGQGLKAKWALNPSVNVWEVTNEWDAHYDWQADFFIALMDLAEPDGYRIAAFSSSYGTPQVYSDEVYPGDVRPIRVNVARVCARAKAHGGHMLALHEYSPDGTLKNYYDNHGGDNNGIVLRYRKWNEYLKTYNDPSKGYVGADCPIIITECGNNGGGAFIGDQPLVNDMAWYDSKVRQDSYLLGVATWNFGHQGGLIADADASTALDEFADYICNN